MQQCKKHVQVGAAAVAVHAPRLCVDRQPEGDSLAHTRAHTHTHTHTHNVTRCRTATAPTSTHMALQRLLKFVRGQVAQTGQLHREARQRRSLDGAAAQLADAPGCDAPHSHVVAVGRPSARNDSHAVAQVPLSDTLDAGVALHQHVAAACRNVQLPGQLSARHVWRRRHNG